MKRCYSTEPLPLPNEPEKTYSPKIQKIVDDISQLTLIEVSDLNELLKVIRQTCCKMLCFNDYNLLSQKYG